MTMKTILKLSVSMFFSILCTMFVFGMFAQITEARTSLPFDTISPQNQAITYTIYLPYISKQGALSMPMAYGINVDPTNYTSNITHVQTIGFEWVAFQMAWMDIETTPGNLNWSRWDGPINAYHNNGIKVLLTITKAPDWARPIDDNKALHGLPDDPQTYANFVISVTNRYSDAIKAIEVWDGQNLYYEVGGEGRVDVNKYMALLQTTYTTLKSQHPSIIIVSGGLIPTGAPYPYAVDDREYLQQMYALNLKEYSDAIGVKPWGFANPPDALYTGGDYDPNRGFDDHRSFFFRNTMEDYRQIMVNAGDEDKQVWATDFGWPVWQFENDHRYWFAKDTTLEEQAQYTQRAYEMGKAWGWVGAMFLWNLDYAITASNTALANFGILDLNGPTPAYNALKDMPK